VLAADLAADHVLQVAAVDLVLQVAAVDLLAGLAPAELAQLHLYPPEQHAGPQLGDHCLLLCCFNPAAQRLFIYDAIVAGCAWLAAAVLAAHQTSYPR